jgi:hypothetical protein
MVRSRTSERPDIRGASGNSSHHMNKLPGNGIWAYTTLANRWSFLGGI